MERTDAEAPILWPPVVKNWHIVKDPDAGNNLRQERKRTTEDEMLRWHHRLHGHEFEKALGVADGQGGLACCSPWGHKESDTTEWLNWTEAGFIKTKGTRDQIANIHWIIEKAREFQKNICFIDYPKAFDCVDHNKLWKILKQMGISDHLTCLLRNLYAGQEATEPDMEQTGSNLGKEYIKAVYCYPAYLTYMQSSSSEMLGWMKHKLESKLLGEISITSEI